MNKVIILLSYLSCCVTAGRFGLERKLWWLDNLRAGPNIPTYHVQTLPTMNQRQQFLLDVLLQVHKPLVNTELVELGKILITDPKKYKEPLEDILLDFLELARNQEILGRNEIYNPADMRHVRQLVGLKSFFVQARDWTTFQRNVCFARLHISPVMFVNALSLAVRERPDTQDLVLPSKNEILPQLYYDNDVLVSAQNTDWDNLISQTTWGRPSWLNTWGWRPKGSLMPSNLLHRGIDLINPWQKWRMQMARGPPAPIINSIGGGKVSGGRHVDAKKRGRNDSVDVEPEAGIVLAITNQAKVLANDISLNIVWSNIINDQLIQAVEQKNMHGIRSKIRDQVREQNAYLDTLKTVNKLTSGIQRDGNIDKSTSENQATLVQKGNADRADQTGLAIQRLHDQGEEISHETVNLPEVNVNSDRLLHKNRRYRRTKGWQSISDQSMWSDQENTESTVKWNDHLYGLNDEWVENSSRTKTPWLNQQNDDVDDRNTIESMIRYRLEREASDHVKESINTQQLSRMRHGEILLQSLKELTALLMMDKIVDRIENRGEQWRAMSLQEQQRLYQITPVIDKVMQQIHAVFKEMIPESKSQALNIIADVLAGALVPEEEKITTDTQRILQSLNRQIKRIVKNVHGSVDKVTPLSLLTGDLSDPISQQIIISLNQRLDVYRRQLQSYTKEDLLADGITIQNVQIEPLVTYWDVVDTDLINLIDLQLLQSSGNNLHKMSQKVVVRQLHLNHQPFTITLNVESLRKQEVIIRILLGPKIDVNGRPASLQQNLHSFITLDAFRQQLQMGGNLIQRNSQNVIGTSRDASTLSQIYRDVMIGRLSKQSLNVGCQLPHRLLLPRGAIGDGLPVQLLVAVTPLPSEDRLTQLMGINTESICGLGIAGINLDQLPLGFPLDGQIADVQDLMVPNIMLINAVIHHDDHLRN